MNEYIRISGVMVGQASDGSRAMTEDEAVAVANLLAADATYGTFGDFPPKYWNSRLSKSIDKLAKAETSVRSSDRGEFAFHLDISSALFDPSKGGLQHFLGVLAGDLFTLQVQGLKLNQIKVEEVIFPNAWQSKIQSQFRDNSAHTIPEIRSAFKLDDDEPLLAFSVKPRIGIKQEALREITLGVLKAGFHIVELDTRNLELDDKAVEGLVALAEDAAAIADAHVTRFSPNLSVNPTLALQLCEQFRKRIPDPLVVKVDGGLDGISTCQQLRSTYRRDRQKSRSDTPIITTYPLLRRLMQDRAGYDTFLQALVWSGSDIIYPGGAPNLGGTYRQLDYAAKDALTKSVNRYLNFVESGIPMPTIAGGVYPGQLQAYYELLGPNVAYFLGGGVALHQNGPVEGAKLCVDILNHAREARQKAGKDNFAADISKHLIESAEGAYAVPQGADPNTFRYISPRTDLPDAPGLKPWFKR
jgi:ribulose 1,5-bisphosphate carboxylase large subunit-like protein